MAIEGEPVDAEAIIAGYEADGDFTDVCESLNELARIETLFGDYAAAYAYGARAEPYIEAGAAGTLLFNYLFWMHSRHGRRAPIGERRTRSTRSSNG